MKSIIYGLILLMMATAAQAFPTPPWIAFCAAQNKAGIPCNVVTYLAKQGWMVPTKPVAATVTAFTVPTSWGTTAAGVTKAFPGVVAASFGSNANLNAQVTGSTILLARFSIEMAAQDPTLVNTRLMYEHAAQKLSAAKAHTSATTAANASWSATIPASN